MNSATQDSARALVDADVAECQSRIGHQFNNVFLLESALTHASSADHRLASNERLEFLGDAVLGLVVCDELYKSYPECLEGELTRIKSIVVSRETCALISEDLGLAEFLLLGKGMTTSPEIPRSVLADVFEAIVAGIYLDAGIEPARQFILEHLQAHIQQAADSESGGNYKSLLQQFSQRELGMTPTYHLLDEKGPDHSKCFQVAARLGRREFPSAWGRSKKQSEQLAAKNALSALRDKDGD